MEALQKTISMYHTGFLVCCVLCGLFLLCSIAMFIRFNIPKMISDKTGRTLKKSMKQIEEKYARTGMLRSQGLSGPLNTGRTGSRKTGPKTGKNPVYSSAGGSSSGYGGENAGLNAPYGGQNAGRDLAYGSQAGGTGSRIVPPPTPDTPPPAPATDILVPGTDLLGSQQQTAQPSVPQRDIEMTGGGYDSSGQVQLPDGLPMNFRITKKILLVHTDETI